MKFSVLINNYNYARFLAESVGSAAAQTHLPHEIIVVDDGSTDDSLAVLDELKTRFPTLRVHAQPNGGQLSAFRAGVALATGDCCAFLDADDVWEPGHLAEAAALLQTRPEVGLYYCDHRETEGPPLYRAAWPEGAVGPLAGLTAADSARVGTITSALVLRAATARAALDFPSALDADWRVRADDCLIFGASFAGAIAYYHPRATIRYRIHGNNLHAHGQHPLRDYFYRNRKARLFRALGDRYGIYPERLVQVLREEAAFPNHRNRPDLRRRYEDALRKALKSIPGKRSLKLKLLLRHWLNR